MFEALKQSLQEFLSPVEEVTSAKELQSLSAEPLSNQDAEGLALRINIEVARQKKADKNGA